eukprot:1823263-Rhodomonas_salina.3
MSKDKGQRSKVKGQRSKVKGQRGKGRDEGEDGGDEEAEDELGAGAREDEGHEGVEDQLAQELDDLPVPNPDPVPCSRLRVDNTTMMWFRHRSALGD